MVDRVLSHFALSLKGLITPRKKAINGVYVFLLIYGIDSQVAMEFMFPQRTWEGLPVIERPDRMCI